jgi:hypothetical protein
VTIDALDDCSTRFPSDPGYFGPGGDASYANVLAGDQLVLPPGTWATARTQVGGAQFPVLFQFGWYVADYQANTQPPPGAFGGRQAWLGTDMSSNRKISVALAGTPLDSGCGPVAKVP